MNKCVGRTRYFRAFVLVACLAMIGYGLPAIAQEEPIENEEEMSPEQQQAYEQAMEKSFEEEITVTGSLIPRPTLEAMSPVTVMDPEEIVYQGVSRMEDIVRQMPMVFSQQNSTIANGSTGTATIDLRNMGANRTLVLINGRRNAPGDAWTGSSADLNFIPSFLVKRVDVLTGGASSTYGADAVTGVVNFVLDTTFEGVRGGISWGGYQHDNDNATAQAMNEAAGFPYPSGSTLDGQMYDVNVAVGGKFADGKGHATAYVEYLNVDALTKSERDYTNCSVGRGSDGPTCSGSSTIPYGRFWLFDEDWNTVANYVGAWGRGGDSHSFLPRAGDVFNYGPYNHMQRPDTKWTAGAFADYEINEHFDVYTEVMFMDDYSKAQIAPSADFGSTDTLNCDNPMLSDQQRDLLCTQLGLGPDDYTNVVIMRRSVETGPRTSIMRHTDWRLVAGMRGDINDYWSYDVYGLYAEVLSPQEYVGDLFVPRIVDALDVIGDPDDPSTWECRSGNAGCAPWNVFQEGGVTQAAADYIALNEVLVSGTKTQMVSGTLNGDLEGWGLKFPSATEAIQVAVGADYREESLYVHPDEAFEGGLGSGAGGPTVRVDGGYDVTEFFIEALVPLIQDAPLSRDLSLELGYRYSDYSTSGGQNTWKAQGAWAPTDDIKFRLGYAQAVRAPNVRELYRPIGLGLGGSYDPCANDVDTGVPSLSFAECQNTGVTAAQYGNIAPNPADQYNTLEGGNPDLQPETATTFTAGVVFTPQSISGFSIALDYYDIKIEDTIQSLDADSVVSVCATGGDPTLCGFIHRDVAGTLWLFQSAYTVTTQQNIGEIYGEGVDLNYSWLIGLGNSGFLNTSLMGTYVIANRIENPLYGYDCVGYYGNQCAPYPTPEWRHRARFSWETNFNMVFTLGWRYVGSVLIDNASPDPDLANPGLIESWKINGAYENPSFNYFDLAWVWNLHKGIQLVAGCNNIFDEEPPLGPGLNDNDYGPGFYGFYDPYGRTLHAALHFDF